jgi:hypothetical protein
VKAIPVLAAQDSPRLVWSAILERFEVLPVRAGGACLALACVSRRRTQEPQCGAPDGTVQQAERTPATISVTRMSRRDLGG